MAAVEEALPLYESTSEVISLGLARSIRRRAISRLSDHRADWILDSGAGPGVSSRLLIAYGFGRIVGLDPSRVLLTHAKSRLDDSFHAVVGLAENLPFREACFGGAITCFSLRDVRNTLLSLKEFARVIVKNGRLEIVDVGKPDGRLTRRLVGLYIDFGMPIIARALIHGRMRRNPFLMIRPTVHRLATNRRLARLAAEVFGRSCLQKFLLGGLVILEAEKVR